MKAHLTRNHSIIDLERLVAGATLTMNLNVRTVNSAIVPSHRFRHACCKFHFGTEFKKAGIEKPNLAEGEVWGSSTASSLAMCLS